MIRLFRVFFPRSVVALVTSELLLVTLFFVGAVYLLFPDDADIRLWYDDEFYRILPVIGSVLIALYLQDLYSDLRVSSVSILYQQVVLTIGIVFLFQALVAYILPNFMVNRWILILGCVLLLAVLPLWRIAYTRVIYKSLGIESILFLGTNPVTMEIAQRIADKTELGMRVLGCLDERSTAEGHETHPALPVLGTIAEVPRVARELNPSRIVVSLRERRTVLPMYDLLNLRFAGTRIEEVTSTYEAVFGRVAIGMLRPSQLIFSSELGPRRWSLRLHSFFSGLVGLVGVIVASPLMLLVALAVRVTSPGPILYRQVRVGLNGQPFTVFKFRSMVVDAEKKTGAVWATRNDPRITPIGKVIRKTRLDELPQLFNVLRGEMSIVGPRPERPEFVRTLSEQIPFYPQRHSVKPGLTGWAQINYKYGDTFEDTVMKLEYDLYYIKNLSVSLDLYIMFNTVKTMLLTRGAH